MTTGESFFFLFFFCFPPLSTHTACIMATRHRHIRRGGTEQEDASILRLGEEFDNAQCLYTSEVRILLEAQVDSKDGDRENRPTSEGMAKILDHVRTFGRFSNRESVMEVRKLLTSNPELSQFEIAQLANLCCEDAEEAKALIPRYKKNAQLTRTMAQITRIARLTRVFFF
ncbi:HRDC-like protein [Gongronella butleri]|nr:HRDC-like protein [Gongronella butleri]